MQKISVVTINLNNRDGLRETMESVLAQTHPEIEYIVVDGGSADGSAELIARHAARLAFCVSETDEGVYFAQNKGLARAGGEYCLFLNSGDTLYTKTVIADVFAKTRNEDIIYGNLIIKHLDGHEHLGVMPDEISFYQMITDTLWHPVSFIRRDILLQANGFNTKYRIAADYDFFLRTVIIDRARTIHCGKTISVFDLTGISSQPANQALLLSEREAIQKSYFHPSILQLVEEVSLLRQQPVAGGERLIDRFKRWLA